MNPLKKEAWLGCAAGLTGVLMTIQFTCEAIDFWSKGAFEHRGVWFWIGEGVVLLFCLVSTSGCFYLAYAFYFGYVSKVSGNINSADIYKDEKIVLFSSRIYLVVKFNYDYVYEGSRLIFFVSAWKPWICRENTFLSGGK